jgi:hypothetical protein
LASTSAIAPRNKEKAYTKKKIEIIVASLLLLLGLGEPKKKKKRVQILFPLYRSLQQ